MKHILPACLLCLTVAFAAQAADHPKACFDPNNIFVDSVIAFYSCVPLADHLCAQSCGDKAVSSDINTTIKDGKISGTTIICGGSRGGAKPQAVAVNGLADAVFVQCGDARHD